MKTILILNKIPFHKIGYDSFINHEEFNIVYLGKPEANAKIPSGLRCKSFDVLPTENLVDFAKALFDYDHKPVCVLASSEYDLLDAALLRKHWNLQGNTYEQTLATRDKVLMKELLTKAKLRVPKFMNLENLTLEQMKVQLHGFFSEKTKIILKPKSGASSENVRLFDSLSSLRIELERLFEEEFESLKHLQCEEFVEGDILHVDGLVENGKTVSLVTSKYIGTCLKFMNGEPLASCQVPHPQGVEDFTKQIVEALGITSGAIHLEIIVSSNNELVFLEIANRVGGADIANIYFLKTGIELHKESLKSQMHFLKRENIDDGLVQKNQTNQTNQSTSESWFGFLMYPGHLSKGLDVNCIPQKILDSNVWLNYKVQEKKYLAGNVSYQIGDLPFSGTFKSNNYVENETFVRQTFQEVQTSIDAMAYSSCKQISETSE